MRRRIFSWVGVPLSVRGGTSALDCSQRGAVEYARRIGVDDRGVGDAAIGHDGELDFDPAFLVLAHGVGRILRR